ncbi:hypothetical protein [Bosea sp. (in: a-proteobacteria)]|uniref:hypothetical protein n=1 Tax=Bosea sp. (in: a-proteobacteria) TaxID=1871050 RepID=UPI002736248F|nr:hypothetical protein [Bosea sp. (in: a-proteobacteria)]MDP3410805.1 hypothetical protein [Bosea sp. (in: a-proteobacteria)]
MSGASDIITVGLSSEANDMLDELKELGIFADKMDGYRFAVALAIAQGVKPPEIVKRQTFLNVGSLDPDQMLRRTVEALMSDMLNETSVYRLVERLADWGLRELHAQAKAGDIDFVGLLGQVEAV